MDAKILLFHINLEKKVRILALCRQLEMEPVVVEKAKYHQQMGVLAGIVGFKEKGGRFEGKELPGEMMVFSGMDENMLDMFLAEYKKAGIAPIALKAVLTPHNIRWTPEELFRELMGEHQTFLSV